MAADEFDRSALVSGIDTFSVSAEVRFVGPASAFLQVPQYSCRLIHQRRTR